MKKQLLFLASFIGCFTAFGQIDYTKAVGKTNGYANVTETGSATYEIPIYVPSGVKGMQPEISLVYNNQLNNGFLGKGWALKGLESIIRQPRNIYLFDNPARVKFDNTDLFVWNGNALIPAGNGEYKTEIETFCKVSAAPVTGNVSDFTVYTKDGRKMVFDTKDNAPQGTYAWNLSIVTDENGNFMTYSYVPSASSPAYGTNFISKIEYAEGFSSIEFEYDTSFPYDTVYYLGQEIRANKLLKKIEVNNNGLIVRRYIFDYEYINKVPYLKKLTEWGDNSENRLLNSTTFEWSPTNDNVLFTHKNQYISQFTYSGILQKRWELGKQARFLADVDGDGADEIVGVKGQNVYVSKMRNGAFDDPNTHITSVGGLDPSVYYTTMTDVNGDGMSDIVYFGRETVEVMLSTGYLGFYPPTVWSSEIKHNVHTPARSCFMADVNGDKKADLIYVGINTEVYLSTGVKFEKSSAWTTSGFNVSSSYPLKNYVFTADINGDELCDIIRFPYNQTDNMITAISTGSGFAVTSQYINTSNFWKTPDVVNRMPFAVADINNDGFQDLISFMNSGIWAAFSKGDGSYTAAKNQVNSNSYDMRWVYQDDYTVSEASSPRYFVDLDNDGLMDVIRTKADYIYIGKNKGGYYTSPEYVSLYSYPAFDYEIHLRLVGDIDGDKLPDVVRFKRDSLLISFSTRNNARKITTITDGFGNKTAFGYTQLKTPAYPTIAPTGYKLKGGIQVVTELKRTDEERNWHRKTFEYEMPITHLRGKGFLGFINVTSYDEKTGERFINVNKLWNEYAVILPSTKSLSVWGTNISKTEYTYSLQNLGSRRTWIKKTKETNYLYADQISKADFYVYDNTSGNITREIKEVYANLNPSYGTPYFSEDITTAYANCGVWNFKPTYTLKTKKLGTDSFTKTTTYEYNGCYLKNKIIEPYNPLLKLTERVDSYDSYGNPTSRTFINAQGDTRTTLYNYDTYGRFVTSEFNPLFQEKKYWYNSCYGGIYRIFDENSLSTYHIYDDFGRLINIAYPDGIQKPRRFAWAQNTHIPNAIYYIVDSGTAQAPVYTFYDAFDKPVATYTYSGLIGASNIYTQTRYYPNGLISQESLPYSSINTADTDKQWVSYEYDNYKRKTKETSPNSNIEYTYGVRTQQLKDMLNQAVVTKTFDALGRQISVTDDDGSIQYTYNARGLPVKIESNGLITTMTYDYWGNRTSISEPNSGTTTSEYNAWGELVKQTDANNNFTTFAYDKLGRVTQKYINGNSAAEGSTTYVYDAGYRGIGKQAEIHSNKHNTFFEYDECGRLAGQTEIIYGIAASGYNELKEYYTRFEYNQQGKLAKTIYPSGFSVNYTYNSIGELVMINDFQGKKLWHCYSGNLYGQPTGYDWGNTCATFLTYDNTGNLTTLKTGKKSKNGFIPFIPSPALQLEISGNPNPGISDKPSLFAFTSYTFTAGIQDWAYAYNNKDFLTRATCNIASQAQLFEYDKLNRLTKDGVVSIGTIFSRPPIAISYDSKGNITQKKDVGAYTAYANKPHGVSNITTLQGVLPTANCATSYTPFNKVKSISEGINSQLFIYGNQQQRVSSTEKENNFVFKSTYYVNNLYEEEIIGNTTRKIHYIPTQGRQVIIYEQKSPASNAYFYVHTDRLGSYDVITDTNGAIKERLSYDAWGNRRNPTNWNLPEPAGTPHIFTRGYTTHEHLDKFRIINMNGRLYDPVIARFFSPDPYVQLPDNTQSYNRYSYCLNNPLKYVDPTGMLFDEWDVNISTGTIRWISDKGGDETTHLNRRDIDGNLVNTLTYRTRDLDFFTKKGFYSGLPKSASTTELAQNSNIIYIRDDFHFNEFYKVDREPYTGFWGNLDYFLTGGLENGQKYNIDGEWIGLAPITGIAPTPGFAKGVKVLQTGGHILKPSTLKSLGLTKEQGKNAIEALKKSERLPNNFHGKIMSNGDVVNPSTKEIIGNILDFLH